MANDGSPAFSKVGDDVSGIAMGKSSRCPAIGLMTRPKTSTGRQASFYMEFQSFHSDANINEKTTAAKKGYFHHLLIRLTINYWDFYCHFL